MMTNNWYEIVSAKKPLTQGDLIFDCPVLVWKKDIPKLSGKSETEILKSSIDVISVDVVIMTQACDLENNKISNVTLCPHIAVSEYKSLLETKTIAKGENFTTKKWDKYVAELENGTIWHKSLLNSNDTKTILFEHRIVDFYEVYTIPRTFLENVVRNRKIPRPRLLPPYREHLSQAFARFYMRVGLPTPINKIP
jgi:hypothetical protein